MGEGRSPSGRQRCGVGRDLSGGAVRRARGGDRWKRRELRQRDAGLRQSNAWCCEAGMSACVRCESAAGEGTIDSSARRQRGGVD